MSKIDFYEFKNKDKVNLEEQLGGGYSISIKDTSYYYLEDEKKADLKIYLTKIGRKEADSLNIINYDPNGDIENLVFSIYHFCYLNNKHYRVCIENKKEELSILDRMSGKKAKKYWEIEICELSKKDGKKIYECQKRGLRTQESNEIGIKLNAAGETIKKKIFNLMNGLKYDRIRLKLEQQTIYNIQARGEENVS
ncbi:MAG: hypothetical protein ACRC4T_17155 [Cetobacterium sp.]